MDLDDKRDKDINNLGRYLTSVLRHRAIDLKLKMKPDGYVKVLDILSIKEKTKSNRSLNSYNLSDVLIAVKEDNKKRMSIRGKDKDTEIRANQGHSAKLKNILNDDLLLRKIINADELEYCIHGTYYKFLPQIKEFGGLSSMKRKHVHFSTKPFRSEKTISGMRHNCEVLIYLDIKKTLEEGIEIFISDNDVALIPGNISYHLFEKICDANTGKQIKFD